VFGNLYPEDLGISTTPTLSAEDAVARVVAIAGPADRRAAARTGRAAAKTAPSA
jgi:hypothetical protein